MHSFAVGIGLDQEAERRLLDAVASVGDEFQLDPATHWHTRSGSGGIVAAGLHHPAKAIGHRRYVLEERDRVVLFDGLPIDRRGEFSGYDAAALDERWAELPARLDGLFCAARVDLETDQVQVLLDPLGMLPVFHGRAGSKVVVSNHAVVIASTLGIDQIDPLSIATMVALGWPCERRTLWRDITMLPGGALSTITASGVRSQEHFGPRSLARPPQTQRNAGELAQELLTMVRHVGDAGGSIQCAITGGLDTRVMAVLLTRANVPAEYFTLGAPEDTDMVVAKELVARFGWPHETRSGEQPGLDWTQAAWRFVRQTDGLCSLAHLGDYHHLERPLDQLEITIWGVGGEIARAGSGPLVHVAPNIPVVSRLPAVQRRVLAMKLNDHGMLTERGLALAADSLEVFARRRRAEGWPTRVLSETHYAFERVCGWATTATRRSSGESDLFSPFCTRAFVEYAFALKPGERYLEAAHYRLMKELMPEVLDVRFEQPFKPQRPELAGVFAIADVVRLLREGRRETVAPPPGEAAPRPFLDRWLDEHLDLIGDAAERAPASIWDVVDRELFYSMLHSHPDRRDPYRNQVLHVATALLLLTQPGKAGS